MDRFEAIRTLIAAVDGGSLSAASRSLGVPLPTVSRRRSTIIGSRRFLARIFSIQKASVPWARPVEDLDSGNSQNEPRLYESRLGNAT